MEIHPPERPIPIDARPESVIITATGRVPCPPQRKSLLQKITFMRIGIVSDTHGQLETTQAAVDRLKLLDVQAVLHCGDIGSLEVVPLFSSWPTHFVFGNVDHDEEELRREIETAGQTCHARFGDLQLGGRRIALLHSDDARRFHQVQRSGEYDLVCYGHTHCAEEHRDGSTLVLNPGALHRARPHSFAVVDLPLLHVEFVPLPE